MAFRMERVARLRTHLRELRAAELEALISQRVQLQSASSEALRRREGSLDDEARLAAMGPLDEPTFRLGRLWQEALRQREQEIARALEELEARIDQKRADVRQARQDEQKLLRLEERHTLEVARENQTQIDAGLDDFAMRVHATGGVVRDVGSKTR